MFRPPVLNLSSLHLLKLVVVLTITAFSCNLKATTAKTFTFGAFVFPPLSMQNEDTNECYGTAIEITKRIIEESGHQLTIICAPANRIYKMMAQGKVDFTINIKSTRLLKPHTTFVDPRFTTIKLQLLEYDLDMPKIVSGIRGFDYLGYRNKLVQDGYEFSDLATSDESITVFIKRRTKALLTYDMLIDTYMDKYLNNKLPENLTILEIISIGSHYGVSVHSKYHDEIISILNDYMAKNSIKEFTDAS